MSDIFLNYAREDNFKAKRLADVLAERGWSVWWDPAPKCEICCKLLKHGVAESIEDEEEDGRLLPEWSNDPRQHLLDR